MTDMNVDVSGIDWSLYCEECDTVHECGEKDYDQAHGCRRDITHADAGVCSVCRSRRVHIKLEDEEALATASPSERAACNCGWRGPWRPHYLYGGKREPGDSPSSDAIWHNVMSRLLSKPDTQMGAVILGKGSDLGAFL